MNPFELARSDLRLSPGPDEVRARLDHLLREGFDDDGRHYRLFGARLGDRFTMSLGMPVLGGGSPVVRGRIRAASPGSELELRAGARAEFMLLMLFWLLLTVLGGSYQVFLQVRRVAAGEAPVSAVTDVLPGIAILSALIGGGMWLWRRRSRRTALALIALLRQRLGSNGPAGFAADLPAPTS
jgi:hypothetical protein